MVIYGAKLVLGMQKCCFYLQGLLCFAYITTLDFGGLVEYVYHSVRLQEARVESSNIN